jgi:hypothetical protein
MLKKLEKTPEAEDNKHAKKRRKKEKKEYMEKEEKEKKEYTEKLEKKRGKQRRDRSSSSPKPKKPGRCSASGEEHDLTSDAAAGSGDKPAKPAAGGKPAAGCVGGSLTEDLVPAWIQRIHKGVPVVGSMWFSATDFDPACAKSTYLDGFHCLTESLETATLELPLLRDGGARPCPSTRQPLALGPEGFVKDAVLGLCKKHEFEFRRPTSRKATCDIDIWHTHQCDFRSAAGDAMFSKDVWHPQLAPTPMACVGADVSAGDASTLITKGRDGETRYRIVYGTSLAGLFEQFKNQASSAELHETFMTWPVIFAKKTRQGRGYGSAQHAYNRPSAAGEEAAHPGWWHGQSRNSRG